MNEICEEKDFEIGLSLSNAIDNLNIYMEISQDLSVKNVIHMLDEKMSSCIKETQVICRICLQPVEQIAEYRLGAIHSEVTPDEFAMNDGTYDKHTNTVNCTMCD